MGRGPFATWRRIAWVWILLPALLAGCAGPGPATPGEEISTPKGTAQAPRKLTAAIQGDPHTVFQQFNPSGTVKGIASLQDLVHADLYRQDTGGTMHPQLAEAAVPVVEGSLRHGE